jgi:hypothetical protein
MDIVYVTGIILFLGLTFSLVMGCVKLGGSQASQGEKQ